MLGIEYELPKTRPCRPPPFLPRDRREAELLRAIDGATRRAARSTPTGSRSTATRARPNSCARSKRSSRWRPTRRVPAHDPAAVAARRGRRSALAAARRAAGDRELHARGRAAVLVTARRSGAASPRPTKHDVQFCDGCEKSVYYCTACPRRAIAPRAGSASRSIRARCAGSATSARRSATADAAPAARISARSPAMLPALRRRAVHGDASA